MSSMESNHHCREKCNNKESSGIKEDVLSSEPSDPASPPNSSSAYTNKLQQLSTAPRIRDSYGSHPPCPLDACHARCFKCSKSYWLRRLLHCSNWSAIWSHLHGWTPIWCLFSEYIIMTMSCTVQGFFPARSSAMATWCCFPVSQNPSAAIPTTPPPSPKLRAVP